jgi:hypothetical protein
MQKQKPAQEGMATWVSLPCTPRFPWCHCQRRGNTSSSWRSGGGGSGRRGALQVDAVEDMQA